MKETLSFSHLGVGVTALSLFGALPNGLSTSKHTILPIEHLMEEAVYQVNGDLGQARYEMGLGNRTHKLTFIEVKFQEKLFICFCVVLVGRKSQKKGKRKP